LVRAGIIATAAAAVALAGCGSSSHATVKTAPVRPTCATGAVRVPVGAELDLGGCGAASHAELVSGTALKASGELTFAAVQAGSAIVDVSSGPVCSPGAVCSQLRVQRATLHVTVR
jgi:hypothetical protein